MNTFDFVPRPPVYNSWGRLITREPVDFEDFLVEVWRFQSVGRDEDARRLLAAIWSWGADAAEPDRVIRVALRLFDLLSPVSDDLEAWQALAPAFVVYRAESDVADPRRGLCWTLRRDIAEIHADRHGLVITEGRVRKSDVLGFIKDRGEDEIIVRRENVEVVA